MGCLMSSLFLIKCLCRAWIGSKGASWQGIQMLSPHPFWVLDHGRWRLHAPFAAVDSAMFAKVAYRCGLNFLGSWIGGKTLPLQSWEKKDRLQMACMHISRPDDLLSPLLRTSSIEIVTGAHLLQKDDWGWSSSSLSRILHRQGPASHLKPHQLCSFLIARSFALTVFPTRCPAYKDTHVKRMSSLAGSASLDLIPMPSQHNRKNSRN